MKLGTVQVVEGGDIALAYRKRTLTGTGPDVSAVNTAGASWKYVVEDRFGRG